MTTQAKRDYYEILGVARTAKTYEIKSAFEKLAAEIKTAGKPANIDDVEKIRSITTAYRVLSDTDKRRRYDESGQAFIGDEKNRMAGPGQDKLDELLQWLEDRRESSSSDY